jgi:hypothetical protein
MMRLVRPFMSQKSLEKMAICSAKNTETQDLSRCPFARAFLQPPQLPSFLGGAAASTPRLTR